MSANVRLQNRYTFEQRGDTCMEILYMNQHQHHKIYFIVFLHLFC